MQNKVEEIPKLMINFDEVTGKNKQERSPRSPPHKKRSWKRFKDFKAFVEYSNDITYVQKTIQ